MMEKVASGYEVCSTNTEQMVVAAAQKQAGWVPC